jgi:hypothetical protein
MRLAFWRADPLADYSDDELHTAALRMVFPGGTNRCHSVIACDREAANIAALRAKYADYEPLRMRRQIMRWLDYAQRNVVSDRRRAEENQRIDHLVARLRAGR